MEDLRGMLEPGMVVQVLGGYSGEIINCIVSKDACELFDNEDRFKVEDFNSSLINKLESKVTRIYENTAEGLKCIWDRDKDFIDPVDWSKYDGIKNDVKVLVKDKKDKKWKKRYFSHVDERGFVHAWSLGSTGWCSNYDLNHTKSWEQAVLYEGNEHLVESKEEN